MKINIIDEQKEINITRAEYEKARSEYDTITMFMVDPPSFEVWLARRQALRRIEGGGHG